MPRLSLWFIRMSLIYLFLGILIGALILITKAGLISTQFWTLLPAHKEFLLLGWMVQLAMGGGFWILPRLSGGRGRGRVSIAWLAFFLLNIGVLMSGIGPVIGASEAIPLMGRIAELSAGVAFLIHAWPRIKPWYL